MRMIDHIAAEVMVRLGRPVEAALTGALRRLGRERPEVFERLGDFRGVEILLSPADLPVDFTMTPDGERGAVNVVRKGERRSCAAEISAPFGTLLSLMGGAADADSTFFSRRVRVSGDTGAAVALHNTLEAAGLTAADLLGLPHAIRPGANSLITAAAARLRSMRRRSGRG